MAIYVFVSLENMQLAKTDGRIKIFIRLPVWNEAQS